MRIHFERTGGVAGVRLASNLASDALPESEAIALKRLVEASGFLDLPARIDAVASAGSGGDRFNYTITVDDGPRSQTVQVSEAAAPPALRALIGWLAQAARRR